MRVHASFQANLAVLIKSVGCHGQNRSVCIQRIGSDRLRRIDTVEIRHLDIHQDQGVTMLSSLCERNFTILGQIHQQPDILQQAARNL